MGTYAPTYSMRAIDNDNDGKIDTIVYLPVYAGEVTSKGTKQITVKYLDDTTTNFKFEDNNIYEGADKDDYVLVTASANTAYDENTIVKMDSISGKVTATRDGKVQIDGKWYTDYSGENFRLDGTYTFYVAGSFVFYADQKGAASLTDVLYLDKYDGSGITAQAKVYFYDGTSATVDIGDIYEADEDTDVPDSELTSDGLRGLYTYNKSGNEYDLTRVGVFYYTEDDDGTRTEVAADDVDDDTLSAENLLGYDPAEVDSLTKATDNVAGKLNGTISFGDDAVVFIRYKDGDKVKVVSGAVAKNYNEARDSLSGYALYDTVNGTDKVIVAYIDMGAEDLPNAKGVNGNYGYIVDKPFTTKIDGTKVVGYTIWDGKSEVTVYEELNSIPPFAEKGAFITFDDLGDGMIDNAAIANNGKDKALTDAAVKGIDGKTFTIYDDADNTYIITDDTTILYVDSEEVEGVETGSLQTAAEDSSNNGINNIKYIVDEADGDNAFKLDLLVIEINNEWK